MRQNLDKLLAHHQRLGAATQRLHNANDNDQPGKMRSPDRRRASSGSSSSSSAHGHAKLEQRPILYADRRPTFLNGFAPFNGCPTTGDLMHAWPLLNDPRRTVFKLQALLSSGQLGRDVLQEIVYFAEANAPIAGLQSLVALLLPDDECVEYLLDVRPDRLLDWAIDTIDVLPSATKQQQQQQQASGVGDGGVDAGTTTTSGGVTDDSDQRWLALLIKTLERKSTLVQRFDVVFFETIITGECWFGLGGTQITMRRK